MNSGKGELNNMDWIDVQWLIACITAASILTISGFLLLFTVIVYFKGKK